MTKNDTEKRLNAALRIFQNDPNMPLREAQRILARTVGRGMRHESLSLLREGVRTARSAPTPELKAAAHRSLKMGLSSPLAEEVLAAGDVEPSLAELHSPVMHPDEEYDGFKPGTRRVAIGFIGATLTAMAIAIVGAIGLNYAVFGTTGLENDTKTFSATDTDAGRYFYFKELPIHLDAGDFGEGEGE